MTSSTRNSLLGASIGAAAMFLADPVRGARRRALVRDKLVWASRRTREGAGATWRDLGNRMSGMQARMRSGSASTDDATLNDRIRTALGRVTAHPRAVSVMVTNGWVVLTGDALAVEAPSIVSAVNSVPGVEGVENQMRMHPTSGNIPALQGGSARPGQWRSWLGSGWSPTTKFLAGAGLGICALAALGRR